MGLGAEPPLGLASQLMGVATLEVGVATLEVGVAPHEVGVATHEVGVSLCERVERSVSELAKQTQLPLKPNNFACI